MTINYGRDIRAGRLARGWSRQQLAEEATITIEQLEALEAGESTDGQGQVVAALPHTG